MNNDVKYKFISVLLVIACVLAVIPVLEMGIVDDWSYTYTAKKLAETGYLTYNGWAAFPIGVQAYWAALWIKLFGFSFTLVRLTTLPFAAGCGWLIYRLHRQGGIGPNLSLLGTLTIVLSPLFLMLAASFMTDVPSLFFFLLAISGYACAIDQSQSEDKNISVRWLVVATVAGLLGTTIRQNVWLAPMLALPYIALRQRTERRIAVTASVLWIISAGTGILILSWYKAQPYSYPPESLLSPLRFLQHLPLQALRREIRMILTLMLLVCPILVGSLFWQKAYKLTVRNYTMLALFMIGTLLVCRRLHVYEQWYPDWLTKYNGYWTASLIGSLPPGLSIQVHFLLLYVTISITGLTITLLVAIASYDEQPSVKNVPVVLSLLLLIVGVYAFMAFMRENVHNRYVLPVLPAASITLLWNVHRRLGDRVSIMGWVSIGLLAIYGVAGIHDYFAMSRARCQAVAILMNAGISRTHIMAGLEYDGGTQIEQQGYINNDWLQNPPGAYHKRLDHAPSIPNREWFYSLTPAIQLQYAVVLSRQPVLRDTNIAPVEYIAWLPPFKRRVFIQKTQEAPEPVQLRQSKKLGY